MRPEAEKKSEWGPFHRRVAGWGQSGRVGADWIFREQVPGSCRCPGPRRCSVSGISRGSLSRPPRPPAPPRWRRVRNVLGPILHAEAFCLQTERSVCFLPPSRGTARGHRRVSAPGLGGLGRGGRAGGSQGTLSRSRFGAEAGAPRRRGAWRAAGPAPSSGPGARLGPRGRRRPRSRCSARGPTREAYLARSAAAPGAWAAGGGFGPGRGPSLGAPRARPGRRQAFALLAAQSPCLLNSSRKKWAHQWSS